jgi:hypothetical protein
VKSYGILYRTVRGFLHVVHPNVINDKMIIEELSRIFGEVGHFTEVVSPLVPEPFVDLVPSKRLHAVLREEFSQFIPAKGSYVGFCSHQMVLAEKKSARESGASTSVY